MWVAITSEHDIQIMPAEEQYYHLANVTCECCPVAHVAEDGTIVIKHNYFSDKEIFERASESRLHTMKQSIDC